MHTGAVYGFVSILLRLIEAEKPDLLAVAFDAKEKTFRHKKFPEYKATRDDMPEELADQLPYIRKVVEAMHIPFLIFPTYEADDIIGTLTESAKEKDIETFIVSGDKDFLQLVGPKVKLYNLKKGNEVELLGDEGSEKKWGVQTKHVIDLLGLMGDASDNVPGIPGIGPKTASKLISEYGSLEEIYANLDNVKPERIRNKLKEHKDQAFLCKDLVTICKKVPLSLSAEELSPGAPDVNRLRKLYEELEFHSLSKNLSEETPKKAPDSNYVLVQTTQELDQLVKTLESAEVFALDSETTGLHPADVRAVGLSFSTQEGSAHYVPLQGIALSPKEVLGRLRPILEDKKKPKGGQNIKFDRTVLANEGIFLQGIVFDSMLESYLLDPSIRQHGIDTLSQKHLGITKTKTEELIGKGKKQISMLDVDQERIKNYACEDADITLRLHKHLFPKLKKLQLAPLYQDVELPLIEVLGDMERVGIALDKESLSKLSRKLTQRLKELTTRIFEEAGEEFNIKSPKQLGPILFEKLKIQDAVGVKRVKKTKTGYSTDQDTLETYAKHPIVASLLEYRNLSKLQSTYVDSLPELIHPKTGRIHTSFNQTITATGRLSSSEPNLQNIPIRTPLGKEIRAAFVPGHKGWKFLSADYSQIELRILAHLSEDPTLIETFQNNEDVHRRTASVVFGVKNENVSSELRGRAKAINFGVIYGMGSRRLSQETGISLEEAKEFIANYFEKYPGIRDFLENTKDQARKNEFVTTILGRRRDVSDINSSNPRMFTNAERIAINTPIQGSAADLIKLAMLRIHKKLHEGFKAKMLLQVHDELLFEAPENELEPLKEMVRYEMEHAMELRVPTLVQIGVGNNWLEAH